MASKQNTSQSNRKRTNRGGHGGRGSHRQCSYCKRMIHTQDTSYSLHGFPEKSVNISKSRKPEIRLSEADYQKYLQLEVVKKS